MHTTWAQYVGNYAGQCRVNIVQIKISTSINIFKNWVEKYKVKISLLIKADHVLVQIYK